MIDTCIHHRWAAETEVHEFFDENWHGYVGEVGSLPRGAGARPIFPMFRYLNPAGEELASAYPADGSVAGSNYRKIVEDAVEGKVERALLLFDKGMFVSALPNPHLATAAVRAVNDWNVHRWLNRDNRLHGAILAPTQAPEAAAAEIRRLADNPQIAGVLLAGISLGKMFGHPIYEPIYAAAAEAGLPLIIHRGGDAINETPTWPAGGLPLTFAEYSTVAPLSLMSQVMSFITNGVLAKYPNLRLLVVGSGVTWIPGFLRRMEMLYRGLRREIPWVTESPSAYFYRQVRVSTYGFEKNAQPARLKAFFEQNPELRTVLCYGSGYPSWDTATSDELGAVLPVAWHEDVFGRNAESWLRWSNATTPQTVG